MLVNFYSLADPSCYPVCLGACSASTAPCFERKVAEVFVLNFVWATYNGLWNTCLEVSWGRSVASGKREVVSASRQVMNKATTAMGPLVGIALFFTARDPRDKDAWNLSTVTAVMLFGTAFTILPVLLCFAFRRSQEVK